MGRSRELGVFDPVKEAQLCEGDSQHRLGLVAGVWCSRLVGPCGLVEAGTLVPRDEIDGGVFLSEPACSRHCHTRKPCVDRIHVSSVAARAWRPHANSLFEAREKAARGHNTEEDFSLAGH